LRSESKKCEIDPTGELITLFQTPVAGFGRGEGMWKESGGKEIGGDDGKIG